MNKRLECKITGRVQRIMFRDFTARSAKKLGLVGEVKNMKDGSVFVVAEGEEGKLKDLLAKLQKGPVLARVEKVEEKWKEAMGEFKNFKIDFYAERR